MAQRGVNKVILVGKLGQDPEVRDVNTGKMATLSIATSENWKDKTTGEAKEITEWHRVTVFGPTANFLEQYATKGAQVYVEAQLKTRKWQDESGKDQYSLDIVVQGFNGSVQLLGGGQRNEGAAPAQQGAAPAAPQAQAPAQAAPQAPAPQQAPPVDDDDDIPF